MPWSPEDNAARWAPSNRVNQKVTWHKPKNHLAAMTLKSQSCRRSPILHLREHDPHEPVISRDSGPLLGPGISSNPSSRLVRQCMSMAWARHWNVAPAFARPKGMQT